MFIMYKCFKRFFLILHVIFFYFWGIFKLFQLFKILTLVMTIGKLYFFDKFASAVVDEEKKIKTVYKWPCTVPCSTSSCGSHKQVERGGVKLNAKRIVFWKMSAQSCVCNTPSAEHVWTVSMVRGAIRRRSTKPPGWLDAFQSWQLALVKRHNTALVRTTRISD